MRADTTFFVTVNCDSRPIPNQQIESVLYGAKDWLRWSPDTYLIRTNLDAEEWFQRVRKVLDPKDNIFVVAVDLTQKAGWMTNLAINWVVRDEAALPGGQ